MSGFGANSVSLPPITATEAYEKWDGHFIAGDFFLQDILNPQFEAVYDDDLSPAPAMDEIAPEAQALIDETFGQD